MQIRDRIRELRRVKAGDIESHPLNWRTHPASQLEALEGILGEVGMADVLLCFPADGKGPNGDFSRLMTFDGHARKNRDPNQEWPVVVTDLTRAEADKMLLSVDPLAAMAETNAAKLDELLRDVQTGSEALSQMLSQVANDAGLYESIGTSEPPPSVDENASELASIKSQRRSGNDTKASKSDTEKYSEPRIKGSGTKRTRAARR